MKEDMSDIIFIVGATALVCSFVPPVVISGACGLYFIVRELRK
jgi:hypothetical protein